MQLWILATAVFGFSACLVLVVAAAPIPFSPPLDVEARKVRRFPVTGHVILDLPSSTIRLLITTLAHAVCTHASENRTKSVRPPSFDSTWPVLIRSWASVMTCLTCCHFIPHFLYFHRYIYCTPSPTSMYPSYSVTV
ncbi:hypothetical protein B0H10DRAFT_1298429 [Mycena sp. CBHHK59/15]|nr:hypothetical protein B0H10DRAFT_1298429 [Mycena sp. CBHHK59/15]